MRTTTAALAALTVLGAAGCSSMGASVESRSFPPTKEGALAAIDLAMAQSGGNRVLYVEYKPDKAKRAHLWEVANGIDDVDLARCEVYRPWVCADRLRVDAAYVVRFNVQGGRKQPPLAVTWVPADEDLIAVAKRLKTEGGDYVLLVRYPAKGSARGAVEKYGWMWRPLDVQLSVVAPEMLCISTEHILDQGCEAYEDIRSINVVTLTEQDGKEIRTHREFAPTYLGATAAVEQLRLQDGKRRFVHVEIPRRVDTTYSSGEFSAHFSGVTQLDETKICGGRTVSLVDELCFPFEIVSQMTVTDWRATPGEFLGALAAMPFQLARGLLSPV